MSVREIDRNVSKVEFLSNFHELRKEIEFMLMRDFGIKKRILTLSAVEQMYKFSEEEKKTYEQLMIKVGANSEIIDKYPIWLVNYWRDSILKSLNGVGSHIELANSIYVTSKEELIERRNNWNAALGYLNALKDNLQNVVYCAKDNISLGTFESVINRLMKEIALIKGIRKADFNKNKKFLVD